MIIAGIAAGPPTTAGPQKAFPPFPPYGRPCVCPVVKTKMMGNTSKGFPVQTSCNTNSQWPLFLILCSMVKT